MGNHFAGHFRLMNFSFTTWAGVSMVEVGNRRCLCAFFEEEWCDRSGPFYSSDKLF